jgi:hypothetical protein
MEQSVENRIRERAYEMWTAHGCVHGQAEQHWLAAEREVLGTTTAVLAQIRRRTHGRPHVRRPPERSRWLADAGDLTRDASPCSAAIITKGGDYARGLARRSVA